MKDTNKPKRKRIAVKVSPLNDGTNTPIPDARTPAKLSEGEAYLFKQAENPLGDPHKI
ncbi:hypothetical protein SAMN05421821_12414 [Mucilaginibacter lappiensis]|uniref:Uncharacterized protein n=1 Tax=Mucilaginibacter lappiensis TaxID=354630 RepID=A0ABR6PSY3_9SPHI|nr:hypothetical protein [Mucilaginibacter lappiensis]MBB6112895.1 hypothetical protein [Mucilaginibacter lappiensis]SIS08970.1 hypothetical protein SAMN05421821_12414 [Mucilaginibacter lappiensis]